jgi:hypothetical protein
MPLVVFAGSSPPRVLEVSLSGQLDEPVGWAAPEGHPII